MAHEWWGWLGTAVPRPSQFVGLDIGGANLKVSSAQGSRSLPFPLWKQPEQLTVALQRLLAEFPIDAAIAVTMTGELADCFTTRQAGVVHIIDVIETAAASRPTRYWQIGGEFLTADEAREFPMLVAAANWHALATWAGRIVPTGTGLLIDMGSTTTDLIPVRDGMPCSIGLNDLERLRQGELVYLGATRTPLCALTPEVQWQGNSYPLAREFFATTYDLALLTGLLPEAPADCETANGRAATVSEAQVRLSRMVCSDMDDMSVEEIQGLAEALQQVQLQILLAALTKVISAQPELPQMVLFAGSGERLAKWAWQQFVEQHPCVAETLSLTDVLGAEPSTAACAWAVAQLLSERAAAAL